MQRDDRLTFKGRDLGLLHAVLNEVLNGFALDDLDAVIGMKRSELDQLLAELHDLPERAEVDLNPAQAMAFRNGLRETLRELGAEEFSIRTGYDFEIGAEVLEQLDQLTSANEDSDADCL